MLAKIDQYQREHPWLGFPLGVVKKFSEDKAGYLASLVAYFGFFSIFPLMLVFTSVLGFVVTDPEAQQRFSDAAADQIPVIGDTIRDTAGQLEGSVVAIVVGLAVALWSGLRIVDAMQNALNDVWGLPRVARPKLVERRLRGLLMLGLIGGGLLASIAASNVAAFVDVIPGSGKVAIWAASAFVSILLYLLAFQLLTDRELPWRDLWPGAIFGGLSWWALQTFGSAYIISQQQSAGDTYGPFAAVIALLAFLFLAAQFSILGAEISVVKSRRLWPRSFTKGEFTRADLVAFEHLAASTQQDENYVILVEPRTETR
jgi:YihY family inner membrane protein